MEPRITQFHPTKSKKELLSTVLTDTSVFLAYEVPEGVKPLNWASYSSHAEDPVHFFPCKEELFHRPRHMRVKDDSLNEFKPAKHFLVLERSGKHKLAVHDYDFCTSPWVKITEPRFTSYEPKVEPASVAYPPSTVVRTIDSWELILKERQAHSAGVRLGLPSLTELLGIKIGLDLRSESSRERYLKETSLIEKEVPIPSDK